MELVETALQTSSFSQDVSHTAKGLQTALQDVSKEQSSFELHPVELEVTFVHFGTSWMTHASVSFFVHAFPRTASGMNVALTIGVDFDVPEPCASPRTMVPSECGGWSAGSSDSSSAGGVVSGVVPSGAGPSAIFVWVEVAQAATAAT